MASSKRFLLTVVLILIITAPLTTLAAVPAIKAKISNAELFEKYQVKLGVGGLIQTPGLPGELKVWIGIPKSSDNVSKTSGLSAKVMPIAPDFDVAPAKGICIKIHPSGTEARFAINPKSIGTFKIGARVLLYNSDACKGIAVPKSAAAVSVKVVVNSESTVKSFSAPLFGLFSKGTAKDSKSSQAQMNAAVPAESIPTPANEASGATSPGHTLAAKNGVIKNEAHVAPLASMTMVTTPPTATKNGASSGTEAMSAEPETMLSLVAPAAEEPSATPSSNAAALEKYKVELAVNGVIQKPGPPGELKVWIGAPEFTPDFSADMTTAETTVPAIGQSARVTPFAPDFDVTPTESICMKVHPSGVDARFSISPKGTGTFTVGADVLLYESDVCEGSPVPKSAASLKVKVVVNKEGVAKSYLLQLWDVVWQGILDFWKWLVATIAALFVFLIRKRLKKWFGFDAPDAGSPTP